MDANNPNRIDPTPVRLSTTLTTERQTPKTDFGDRLKNGLDAAAGAVASGVAVAAPYVPGGAILSAAVSSVTQMSAGPSSGSVAAGGTSTGGSAVMSRYGSLLGGVTPVTGSGGSSVLPGEPNGGSGSTSGTGVPSVPGGPGGGSASSLMQNDMSQQMQDNLQLLRIQISMQRENQVFTTVSNVLKTRHDTVKNTIANVR